MGHASVQSVLIAAVALVCAFAGGSGGGTPRGRAALALESSRAATAETGGEPQRPLATVDVSDPPVTGTIRRLPAGGDLQAAIDAASLGDRIELTPGATYRGPFRLRRKDGQGWVVIASQAIERLPRHGGRVTPAHAPLMAKLVAASEPIIETEEGAHHYRLVGLEVVPAEGTFLRGLVQIGAHESDPDLLPHHIILDRCYLHGDRQRGGRRGVAMNGSHVAVVGSHLSDFKEVGADSQAIAGWNGAGPFRIANNYLEAAGENVMFGGADPLVRGLVPADIEIVGNHVAKPLRWKLDDKSFEGTPWTVKNLFELKNARRVLVADNVFEYNWPHAQNGFSILFTVRNQDGGAPWSIVEDVTFERNLVRHVAAGINILGHDDIHASQQTGRIAIRNNLFLDVGGAWGAGRLFQLLDGTSDVRIDHNTGIHTGTLLTGGDRAPHIRFVFQNNIALHNTYTVVGSGTAPGRPSFDRYFPGSVVRRNVIIGGAAEAFPPDNFFPASLRVVGFQNSDGANLRLAASSTYRRAATDRLDIGADIEAIAKVTARTLGE